MSMNLLSMSNEIKKINNKLTILQNYNKDVLNQLDKNLEEMNNIKTELSCLGNFHQITNEIKDSLNDMECKVENLHYLDPLKKFNNVGENYSEVKNFLEKLNIDEKYINKIMFLNCDTLKRLLLLEDTLLHKLDIPLNIIDYIKDKIEEHLYEKMS